MLACLLDEFLRPRQPAVERDFLHNLKYHLLWTGDEMISNRILLFFYPRPQCHGSDNLLESAGGYGHGEGCGIIILKRLADAIQDGDGIHAVIRATGANSDGFTQGVTVLSLEV
ncbi:hypothetical protein BDW68DRAFT_172535 [Aspergillus falconensis]